MRAGGRETVPARRRSHTAPALTVPVVVHTILPGEEVVGYAAWDEEQAAVASALAADRQILLIPPAAARHSEGRCVGVLVTVLTTETTDGRVASARYCGLRRVRARATGWPRPGTTVTVTEVRDTSVLTPALQRRLDSVAGSDPQPDAPRVAGRRHGQHGHRRASFSLQVDALALSLGVGPALKGRLMGTASPLARLRLLETVQRERAAEAAQRALPPAPDDLETRVGKAALPGAVRAVLERILAAHHGFSDDYEAVVRFALELCWLPRRPRRISLARARRLLDESHAGLDDVKATILDYIALLEWQRRGQGQGTPGLSLCLVGPPGSGKTSFAMAIAAAVGRRLEVFPIGGVDDVFLVGCDRAYRKARPGEIARRIHASGRHPSELLLLLDEIDKVSAERGHGALPVLLALLDPSQNHAWQDHFLDELRIDLSGALFITTANNPDDIPAPLRDRLRLIHLPGYSREHQLAITRSHLLPRLLGRLGIDDQVRMTDDALTAIVFDYEKSDGLRQVEQRLAAVVSRSLRQHLQRGRSVLITAAAVDECLPPLPRSGVVGFQVVRRPRDG